MILTFLIIYNTFYLNSLKAMFLFYLHLVNQCSCSGLSQIEECKADSQNEYCVWTRKTFLNAEHLLKICEAYYVRDHTEIRTLTGMHALKCLLYYNENLISTLFCILEFCKHQETENKVFLVQDAGT